MSTTLDPRLPSWAKDILREPSGSRKPNSSIPDPPGFAPSSALTKKQQSAAAKSSSTPGANARLPLTPYEMDALKLKKSWEIAFAPAKQLPMNAIMMYMSGNSLQIFSMMMVWTLFKNPFTALLQTNAAFARFETEGNRGQLWQVKAVYVLMNLVAFGLGVWKVNQMGLLPTTSSDWLAWEVQREPLETTIFAF